MLTLSMLVQTTFYQRLFKFQQLDLEPLKTTCTMIHTLNSGDLLANGVKTLTFFVRNVANSPLEEKYKKIRLSNAGVQKKIMPLVGGVEFLELSGFTRIKDDAGL